MVDTGRDCSDNFHPTNLLLHQLKRRASLFVADAEISLTQDQVKTLSRHALALAFAADTDYCDEVTNTCLRKLLCMDKMKGQIVTKSTQFDRHQIDCRIGRLRLAAGGCCVNSTAKTR